MAPSFGEPATDSPSLLCRVARGAPEIRFSEWAANPGWAVSGHPAERFRMQPQAFKTKGGPLHGPPKVETMPGAWLALRPGVNAIGMLPQLVNEAAYRANFRLSCGSRLADVGIGNDAGSSSIQSVRRNVHLPARRSD
jgi:hypothetical protein